MPEIAVYVYCVVSKSSRPSAARVPPGIRDAAAPRALDLGRGQWCIAADVPLQAYGPAQVESGLRDLEWVAAVAVAHEAVVEHFARQRDTTVIPMKLFTMFLSAERAVAAMRGRRAALSAAIRRIRGCEEWGVRVTRRALPPPARSAVVASRAHSGTAFLSAKKRARDSAQASARLAGDAAADVLSALERLSRDAVTRSDSPDPAATPPLLDAAFLVPATRRTAFKAAAKRAAAACRKAGVDLTLTGPWPAYNFIDREGRSA